MSPSSTATADSIFNAMQDRPGISARLILARVDNRVLDCLCLFSTSRQNSRKNYCLILNLLQTMHCIALQCSALQHQC